MRKLFGIIYGIILMSLGLITDLHAAQVPSKIVLTGKTPAGVVIGKGQVTIKEGYLFEKISKGRVVSRMRGGRGGITGEFDCTCNGNDGGCSVITTPTSVSCASSGCKSSCYMIVTIPGTSGILQKSR